MTDDPYDFAPFKQPDNVVHAFGALPHEQAKAELLDLIDGLRADIVSGHVVSAAVAGVTRDGVNARVGFVGPNGGHLALLGALRALEHKLLKQAVV